MSNTKFEDIKTALIEKYGSILGFEQQMSSYAQDIAMSNLSEPEDVDSDELADEMQQVLEAKYIQFVNELFPGALNEENVQEFMEFLMG